mmetsp:Transcript_10432/g.15254  ORF Transcript_10432/g.15254 Transcript_10432/m.15254 type:complete len:461 (-) Transcript_10432:30-1412(-)
MPRLTIAGLSKRGVIEIEPQESLYQGLVKFCSNQQLGPAYQYGLKSRMQRGKLLDLQLNLRQSGLTNNAQVEIVELKVKSLLKGKATIHMKMGDDKEFPPTAMTVRRSLYQVLLKMEKEHECSLVNQNNRIPTLTYANQQFVGKANLVETRLIDLGIFPNSAARLTLSYSTTDNNNMVDDEKPSLLKVEEDQKKKNTEVLQNVMVDDEQSKQKVDKEEDHNMVDDEEEEEEEVIQKKQPSKLKYVPLESQKVRELKVYILGTGKREDVQLTKKDFELTGSELKSMIKVSKDRAASNSILKTQKIRDLEAKEKERIYSMVIVRVKLPNGYMIQGSFKPSHKLRRVYHMVRALLFDQSLDFDLFTTPPRHLYNSDADLNTSLKALKFEPTIVLHATSTSMQPNDFALEKSTLENYLEKEFEDTQVPLSQPTDYQKATTIKQNKMKQKKSLEERLMAKMGFKK